MGSPAYGLRSRRWTVPLPVPVDRKVVMTDSTVSTPTPREVRLVSRPVGWPTPADFDLVESQVPDLADGQLRVRNTVM